jgi:hypothetical protein
MAVRCEFLILSWLLPPGDNPIAVNKNIIIIIIIPQLTLCAFTVCYTFTDLGATYYAIFHILLSIETKVNNLDNLWLI